jgi:hypothetical protein
MGEAGDEESTHKWLDLHKVKQSRAERGRHRADDPAGGLPTPIVRAAIVIIISARIANFVIVLISMREANGMVACPIVLCVSDRRTRKRLSLYGPREQMEPYCHEGYQMHPILLHPLARIIIMMESKDDDVTMTVEIVMVIDEIKEVVEVVEVVDKSTSLETQVPPVSLVASLIRPATVVELIPIAPIDNA